MPRATKIVATLGPASSDPAVLERMIRAGVDIKVIQEWVGHASIQETMDTYGHLFKEDKSIAAGKFVDYFKGLVSLNKFTTKKLA